MFTSMRFMLLLITVSLCLAVAWSVFVDLFICYKFHYNWSLNYDEQGQSIWNSWMDFWISWTLNFSANVFLFLIPFFILKALKLRQRQESGLIGVFSLGSITMAISLARFMIYSVSNYNLSDNDGAVMCTAESCTSLIVASLMGLTVLITRTIANHSSSRAGSGHNKSSDTPHSSRIAKISARLSRPLRRASVDDADFELTALPPSEKQHNLKQASSVESMNLDDTQITVKHDFSVEHGIDSKRGSYQNTLSLPFV